MWAHINIFINKKIQMLRIFKPFARYSTRRTPVEPITSSPEIDRVRQALVEEFGFSEGDVDIQIRPKVLYYS